MHRSLELVIPRAGASAGPHGGGGDAPSASAKLEEMLAEFFRLERVDDYKCEQHDAIGVSRLRRFWCPPRVLSLQLMRFGRGTKTKRRVAFPLHLDLTEFVLGFGSAPAAKSGLQLYALRAVVVHKGPALDRGHYVVYVCGADGKWFLMDDQKSMVREVQWSAVCDAEAYLLFYVHLPIGEYTSGDRPSTRARRDDNGASAAAPDQAAAASSAPSVSRRRPRIATVHDSDVRHSERLLERDGLERARKRRDSGARGEVRGPGGRYSDEVRRSDAFRR